MTNTVSLKSDHLGSSRPTVVGHQYTVVGDLTISAYRTGSIANASVNINAAASTDAYTRASGSFITDGFQVGDMICIVGSHADNDTELSRITALTALVMTVDGTAAPVGTPLTDNTGGGEIITHGGEKVLASSFGLSEVHSVEVVGQTSSANNWMVNTIASDGTYFHIVCMVTGSVGNLLASMGGASASALPPVTLKVIGLI
tara:strand:- start:1612 stop:2217 length:606 start_codon:yes stop_codon:yes gene_type:complete